MKTRNIAIIGAVLLLAACDRSPQWTTENGVQITEKVEGTGDLAKQGDIMMMVYVASYVDGEEFQRYQDRKRPFTYHFGMKQVMPGLEEGMVTMRKGSSRVIVIPPEMAFQANGEHPTLVPHNAWVRFEVELLDIERGPPLPRPWNDAGRDIEVTETGLQYVDFHIGHGDFPEQGRTCTINFSVFDDGGRLLQSTVFSGNPVGFQFDAEKMTPGMMEGLLTMQVGGRRKLIIPPHLTGGNQGLDVPENATLTYDVELLDVTDLQ